MYSYGQAKEALTRGHAYPEQPLHRRFRLIVDRIPAGSSVLDIACGTGTILKKLRDKGCRVYGIDIAPGAIRLARAKGLDVMLGDADAFGENRAIRDLLFAPYDVVIFSKSLQHLREKNAIMARLRTKRIFVHQRNRDHWRVRLFGNAGAALPRRKRACREYRLERRIVPLGRILRLFVAGALRQFSARQGRGDRVHEASGWCRVRGLNPRPSVYKTAALPLS
jgi:SAM-dependent methyltransferase